VHLVITVELVAQLLPELGEQAGLDQGRGSGVDAGLALNVTESWSAFAGGYKVCIEARALCCLCDFT